MDIEDGICINMIVRTVQDIQVMKRLPYFPRIRKRVPISGFIAKWSQTEGVAFSTHRDAYAASRFPFSGLNVTTALISPIVPMESRSSGSSSRF